MAIKSKKNFVASLSMALIKVTKVGAIWPLMIEKYLTTTRQKSALSSKLSSQNQALFLTIWHSDTGIVYHTISLAVFFASTNSMGKSRKI